MGRCQQCGFLEEWKVVRRRAAGSPGNAAAASRLDAGQALADAKAAERAERRAQEKKAHRRVAAACTLQQRARAWLAQRRAAAAPEPLERAAAVDAEERAQKESTKALKKNGA